MKKIILIFLIKIFFFSQVPNSFAWDTTAAKFYPLAIGNSYTFLEQELYSQVCIPTYILGVYKVKIIRDTILSNGKKYFIFDGWPSFTSPSNYWKYQRIDSNSMNVLFFDVTGNQEKLLDSLKAQVGDTFRCSRFASPLPWAQFYNTYNIPMFGQNRIQRNYPARGPFPASINYSLLEGIGLRSFSLCELGGVTYYLKGCVINGVVYGDTSLTNVQQIGSSIPDKYNLHQNYPNPFNPSTNIKYDLIKNGNVKISVYDVSGKKVSTLVNQFQNAGSYEVTFNATGFSSGVYFYKLETNNFTNTRRMLLIK